MNENSDKFRNVLENKSDKSRNVLENKSDKTRNVLRGLFERNVLRGLGDVGELQRCQKSDVVDSEARVSSL